MKPTQYNQYNCLMNLSQVAARLSISPSTVRRMIEKGNFPRPLQIAPRRIAWREDAIGQWIEQRQTVTGKNTLEVSK